MIIDGPQCSAVMNGQTGEVLPEYNTKLSVCIRKENVEITYPFCPSACSSLQRDQKMKCVNKESNKLETRTCCWVIKRDSDGWYEEDAHEWVLGEQCPRN